MIIILNLILLELAKIIVLIIYVCLTLRMLEVHKIVYVYKDNINTLTKGIDLAKEIENLLDYIDNIFYTVDNVCDKTNIDVLRYYVYSFNYAERQCAKIAKYNQKEADKISKALNDLRIKTPYYSESLLNEVKASMYF